MEGAVKKSVTLLILMGLLNFANLSFSEELGYLSEIRKLTELKKQNKLTDEEFESQKIEIKKRFFEQAASNSGSGNQNVAADSKVVVLGDTKQIVRLKLGVPLFDGGYYWKYSSSEAVYFDENDKVRELVGFSFTKPETGPVDDGINWALKLIKNGSYSEACELLQKLEKRVPNRAVIHYHLAFCYQKIGETEKSKSYYEKVLKQDPSLFDGSEPIDKKLKNKIVNEKNRRAAAERLLQKQQELQNRQENLERLQKTKEMMARIENLFNNSLNALSNNAWDLEYLTICEEVRSINKSHARLECFVSPNTISDFLFVYSDCFEEYDFDKEVSWHESNKIARNPYSFTNKLVKAWKRFNFAAKKDLEMYFQ